MGKKGTPMWVLVFEGTLFRVDFKGSQQENHPCRGLPILTHIHLPRSRFPLLALGGSLCPHVFEFQAPLKLLQHDRDPQNISAIPPGHLCQCSKWPEFGAIPLVIEKGATEIMGLRAPFICIPSRQCPKVAQNPLD